VKSSLAKVTLALGAAALFVTDAMAQTQTPVAKPVGSLLSPKSAPPKPSAPARATPMGPTVRPQPPQNAPSGN